MQICRLFHVTARLCVLYSWPTELLLLGRAVVLGVPTPDTLTLGVRRWGVCGTVKASRVDHKHPPKGKGLLHTHIEGQQQQQQHRNSSWLRVFNGCCRPSPECCRLQRQLTDGAVCQPCC